jgi:hypothetical protein
MPIVNRVADLQPDIQAWRRDIHQHPELLYDVHRTAAFVAERLREFGCDEVTTGLGRTGVVGVIKGGKPTGSGDVNPSTQGMGVSNNLFEKSAAGKLRSLLIKEACGRQLSGGLGFASSLEKQLEFIRRCFVISRLLSANFRQAACGLAGGTVLGSGQFCSSRVVYWWLVIVCRQGNVRRPVCPALKFETATFVNPRQPFIEHGGPRTGI